MELNRLQKQVIIDIMNSKVLTRGQNDENKRFFK